MNGQLKIWSLEPSHMVWKWRPSIEDAFLFQTSTAWLHHRTIRSRCHRRSTFFEVWNYRLSFESAGWKTTWIGSSCRCHRCSSTLWFCWGGQLRSLGFLSWLCKEGRTLRLFRLLCSWLVWKSRCPKFWPDRLKHLMPGFWNLKIHPNTKLFLCGL